MVKKEKAYTLLVIITKEQEMEEISTSLQGGNFILIKQIASPSDFTRPFPKKIPDLILLNPEVNSKYGNIQYLRKHPTTRQIPVIFLCPPHQANIISECLNYPSTDFITTPLRGQELLLRIHHQLSLLKAKRIIKKQYERLQKTITSRDKLYSVIAHDLRAPIGTIKMINAIIESEKNKIKNTGIRKKFEMINETTEEVFNLLENLLRWTRNQIGKTHVISSQFDIASAIQQVLSLFTTIAAAKNIHLLPCIHLKLSVYADEDMIKTVLRNLISNAIKFTHPGGKIKIHLIAQKGFALISVKDNGIGLSLEEQKKIMTNKKGFTTYGTKNEKGYGLGLQLCQEFIRMNKGKFYIVSKPEKGSTFSFTIPRISKESIPL